MSGFRGMGRWHVLEVAEAADEQWLLIPVHLLLSRDDMLMDAEEAVALCR
jgi:hypothetical protein